MTTNGIQAIYLETHNWGKAAKFFQSLGFELEFETDHNSGQVRNGAGPYVFIAEIPADRTPHLRLVLGVDDADRLQSRTRGRGRHAIRGHPLGHETDDGARPRWPAVEHRRSGAALTVAATPDSTAERVALWRAMHVQVDSPPHVLEDVVGLRAGRSERRLAVTTGHGPRRDAGLPRRHRRPGALHRRPRHEPSGKRRIAIRAVGRGTRHLRPTPGRPGRPDARLRDRPTRQPRRGSANG